MSSGIQQDSVRYNDRIGERSRAVLRVCDYSALRNCSEKLSRAARANGRIAPNIRWHQSSEHPEYRDNSPRPAQYGVLVHRRRLGVPTRT